jgi:hypothetical protein
MNNKVSKYVLIKSKNGDEAIILLENICSLEMKANQNDDGIMDVDKIEYSLTTKDGKAYNQITEETYDYIFVLLSVVDYA